MIHTSNRNGCLSNALYFPKAKNITPQQRNAMVYGKISIIQI